jgi:hypothetical protein
MTTKTRIGKRSWFRCLLFGQKRKLQLEAQAIDHGQLKQIDVHLLKRGDISHVVLYMNKTYKSLQHRLKNMV